MLGRLAEPPRAPAESATTDREQAAAGKVSLDVVSVKLDAGEPTPETRDPSVLRGPHNAFTPTGGLFSATDCRVISHMLFACKLTNEQFPAVRSPLSKWANESRHDIERHATGNPTKDQYRLMMRSLLRERFKLAIHIPERPIELISGGPDRRTLLHPDSGSL